MRRSPVVKKRAAIYARQSQTRDGSDSIAIQLEVDRQTAERFDLEVVVELIEPPSTSAYKNRGRSRRKFAELIELTTAHAIDCVIVYKTDRLSRGGGPGWAPLFDAIESASH